MEPQQYSELVEAFEGVYSDRFRDLRKLLAFNEKDELNPLILALVEMLAPHYKYFSTFGGINHGLHAHEFEGLAEGTGADLVIWGMALHNDMKQPLRVISLGEVLRKATRIKDQVNGCCQGKEIYTFAWFQGCTNNTALSSSAPVATAKRAEWPNYDFRR